MFTARPTHRIPVKSSLGLNGISYHSLTGFWHQITNDNVYIKPEGKCSSKSLSLCREGADSGEGHGERGESSLVCHFCPPTSSDETSQTTVTI